MPGSPGIFYAEQGKWFARATDTARDQLKKLPSPSMAEVQKLRVKGIIAETGDTKSFVLEPVDGNTVRYNSGQFLTFLFRNEDRRNYSISSIPGEPLTITVKRIPNGEYSRYFFDRIAEGDELRTIGASGFFTLPEQPADYHQYFFFAAGSGITPVLPLIKTLLNNHPVVNVVLVYSNRSLDNTIFFAELNALQQQFSGRFHIEYLFSDATHIMNKRLGIYVLEKLLGIYAQGDRTKSLFYLCGPFEYMRMITIVLLSNGVPASHIRKENFTIEVPVNKPQPPDQDPHRITCTVQHKEYHFESRYPDTILQTAKTLQVPLPYSCEAGQCGTCAATCVSGKVWMWRNDVLLDEEIAKGRVLTCTGYAVDGDVELVFQA